MKKVLLFVLLAVFLTACHDCPECPDPEPCPEYEYMPKVTLRDIKANDTLTHDFGAGMLLIDTIIIRSIVCPDYPPTPDPETIYVEVPVYVEVPIYKDTCLEEPGPIAENAYYVAPYGHDSNAGTAEHPWATWGRAFNADLMPGDTVYFRGGVYPHPAADGWDGITCEVDGEPGAYVHFFNYPGEEPILDSKGIKVEWTHNRGLYMKGVNYVHFKGLTIQHVEQRDRGIIKGDIEATAWHLRGTNCIIEQCVVRNCHGGGFGLNNCDNVWVINCDGFNMVDSFTSVPAGNPMPGNDGTAFSDWNTNSTEYRNYFIGNRAWNCGDQGFTSGSIGYTEYINNWSFNNGVLEGGGHGYKMGWIPTIGAPLNRLYRNCLAVNNRRMGWDTNEGNRPCGVLQVENNIAYGNGVGYRVLNSSSSAEAEQNRVYERNVAYNNGTDFQLISGAGCTQIDNSWNVGGAESDWFVSLDASQLMRPRKADGSLPDIDFLELTEEAKTLMNW